MAASSQRWNVLRNRWLLVALASSLAVFPWSFDPTELPRLTLLRLIALGLMLTGLFTVSRSAWASSNEAKVSAIHPLRLPIMLLLTLMGASAFRSFDPWSSLAALVDAAMLVFFTFTFTGAARDAAFQRNALRLLVFVGAICAAWAILQRLLPDPLNGISVERSHGAATGPFATPTLLAGFLAAVFPLAMWQLRHRQEEKAWMIGAGAVLMVGLLFTRQSAPLFAAGAGGLLTLFLGNGVSPRRSERMMGLAACGIVLAFALFFVKSAAYPPGYLSDLRQTGLRMAQAQPLIGWGPGTFGVFAPRFTSSEAVGHHEPNVPPANSPHNEFLSYLVAGGYTSLIVFLWILAGCGVILARRLRSDARWKRGEIAPGDASLAAAWAGFLAAWLIQSVQAPQSISLQMPFWCALGMASSPAVQKAADSPCDPWPKPLRWAGVALALFLIVPIPKPEYAALLKGNLTPNNVIGSGLEAGPGGTFRWLIGDIYYARAIRARDRKDWDAALSAHLATLAWAPSRIANWLGYGETARRAMLDVPQRPFQWTEYGRLGYYRAQLMQPINSYTFYGEAEMLAQAYQKGGKTYYDPARKDFEKAILLAPNYPRFRLDYGALLESAGQVKSALTQYLEAARSGGSEGEAEWRLGRLLVSQGQRQEGLRYLQAAERMSRTSPLHPQIQATLDAVASP